MSYTEGVCRAISLGAKAETASTGTDQVLIEFEIQDGDDKGRMITAYRFLTEKAFARAVEDLKTCGWDGSYNGDDFNFDSVKGVEVLLNLKAEEYKGKTQIKVAFIDPIDREKKPAPTGLGAKWRDRIAALGAPSSKPVAFPD